MRTRFLALVGVSALVASCALVLVGSVDNAGAVPIDSTVKPDAVLSVSNPTWSVQGGTPPKVGNGFFYHPDSCRGRPDSSDAPDAPADAPVVCDAYRIQLNRDPNPKANNVVYFELDFDKTSLPSLDVVAAGLNPVPAEGDMLMHVWDKEDHYLGQNFTTDPSDEDPGGDNPYTPAPSIGGFNAKQSLYDITVEAFAGPAGPYTLRVKYSNEVFTAPHEILDESLTAPSSPTTPETPSTPPDLSGPTDTTPGLLPPATVLPDTDIANVGVGVDQQFNSQQAFNLHNTRTVAAVGKPPSGWLLWLSLVFAPLALGGGVLVVFRRRRAAFIS